MKKAKKAPRSRRAIAMPQLPPQEPEDVTMQKARKLPMFGPGILINVPERLYPSYTKLYHLVPMTLMEVQETEQRLGRRKPDGVVWVKRVPRSAGNDRPRQMRGT